MATGDDVIVSFGPQSHLAAVAPGHSQRRGGGGGGGRGGEGGGGGRGGEGGGEGRGGAGRGSEGGERILYCYLYGVCACQGLYSKINECQFFRSPLPPSLLPSLSPSFPPSLLPSQLVPWSYRPCYHGYDSGGKETGPLSSS